MEDTLSGQAIPMSGTVNTKETQGTNVPLDGILKYVVASDGFQTSDTAQKKRYEDFFKKVQFKGIAQD